MYFESFFFNIEMFIFGMLYFFYIFYFLKCKYILLIYYFLLFYFVNYVEMLIYMRDECLKCVRNWYNFLIVLKLLI